MSLKRALKLPPQILGLLVLSVLAACQPASSPRPVPSVQQIGGDLNCASGDHGYEDFQAGWGFCYPGSWKYNIRSQAETSKQLDLTFDVTDAQPPCPSPGLPQPSGCSPTGGLYSFMIISTYERGDSSALSTWVPANLPKTETLGDSISWGNAVEAAKLSDGKRIALTPHHVVILDLHTGLLDLESDMGSRLNTWKFSY